MTKTNNLFRNFGLIALTVALCFAIVFAIIPKNKVYADVSDVQYTFTGSNFDIGCNIYEHDSGDQFSFLSSVFNGYVYLDGSNFTLYGAYYGHSIFGSFGLVMDIDYIAGTIEYFSNTYNIVYDEFNSFNYSFIIDDVIFAKIDGMHYFCSTGFIPNVNQVVFSNEEVSLVPYNTLKYIDVNGNYFKLYFPHNESYGSYTERTYFLNFDFSDSDIYNNGYNSGYDNGYANGNSDGFSDGLISGKTIGYNNGYSVGYNAGAESASSYTFFSLIGAVIDAPIKAFTSLFSFDLLGTNLGVFITSMLSLAVVIVVIRMALGKF